MSFKETPKFYVAYGLGAVASGLFVLLGFRLVEITILVEIANALMLPVILGVPFLLAFRLLPAGMRLIKGAKAILGSIYVMISGLSIFRLVNMLIR